MSAAATLERPGEVRAHSPVEDGRTLEVAVLAAWEELAADGRCTCVVCGEEMAAGPGVASAAACASCGSALD
jgi:hypothetical protein